MTLSLSALVMLGSIALGCGTIFGLGGPGGTPLVAALVAVTGFRPPMTAGTAGIALFAVLAVGAMMYARSADVRWRVVIVLIPPTLLGTQLGAALNQQVTPTTFRLLFGGLVAVIGVAVLSRELAGLQVVHALGPTTRGGLIVLGGLGLLVGTIGGITGLGGPTITVPALLLLDVPLLEAIGTGQVQGAVTTAATGATYLAKGSVAIGTVGFLVPPLVVGLLVGWVLAHRVDRRLVTLGIGFLLLGVAPYFLL